MSKQEPCPAQPQAAMALSGMLPDSGGLDAATLRQYYRDRLARLFRHGGDTQEGRYLQDLIARYRKLDAS